MVSIKATIVILLQNLPCSFEKFQKNNNCLVLNNLNGNFLLKGLLGSIFPEFSFLKDLQNMNFLETLEKVKNLMKEICPVPSTFYVKVKYEDIQPLVSFTN